MSKTSNGYVICARHADHVIAPPSGVMYEHRMVLFDSIGEGPHRCHWCSTPINWGAGLEVDHLDHVRDNNTPSNLVATCHGCNVKRRDIDAGRWFNRYAGNTHCAAGHEYTPENIYTQAKHPNVRCCRACRRVRDAKRRSG